MSSRWNRRQARIPSSGFANVVLTPHHLPGTHDTMTIKFSEIFADADRFFAGERMENEITMSRARPTTPGQAGRLGSVSHS